MTYDECVERLSACLTNDRWVMLKSIMAGLHHRLHAQPIELPTFDTITAISHGCIGIYS